MSKNYSVAAALLAGNVTIISSLLFNSAILGSFLGGPAAAAQNISSSLGQFKLTPQDKREALAQACAMGLQQREPQAVALLAAVALSASDASAISSGFAKVRNSLVNGPQTTWLHVVVDCDEMSTHGVCAKQLLTIPQLICNVCRPSSDHA